MRRSYVMMVVLATLAVGCDPPLKGMPPGPPFRRGHDCGCGRGLVEPKEATKGFWELMVVDPPE